MSNKISIYLVILCISYGLTQDNGEPPKDDTASLAPNTGNFDITGEWYAVMGTGFNESGHCCNLFKDNISPKCKCISVNFLKMCDNEWDVFFSAYNTETNEIRASEGACSSSDQKIFKCFELSQAEMDLSVITTTKDFISQKVMGAGNFHNYEIDVIGYSIPLKYMITTIKLDNNVEMTSIFFRSQFPGKKLYWDGIVQNLKQLNIDDHKLDFYKQDNCSHPSMAQYDEMLFCQ